METTPEVSDPIQPVKAADLGINPPAPTGSAASQSWAIGADRLRANISHMPLEQQDLMLDCFHWARKNNMTVQEFAREIGSSANTVYKIVNGKYLEPESKRRLNLSDKMVEAMSLWLVTQKGKSEQHEDWVFTPTAGKVWRACDLARESRTPVFIFAPSHLGKTTALLAYQKAHNHGRTIYIRCGVASGLRGLLCTIAKALDIATGRTNTEMIDGIVNAITPETLIILDEVHSIMHTYREDGFFKCIEALREIYDRANQGLQCGLVLVITKVKWTRLLERKKDDLEQMFRRGVHRTALGTVTGQPLMEDIAMILESRGLKFPEPGERVTVTVNRAQLTDEPFEIIHQLSMNDGLKSITERLRYALKLAAADERQTPSWQDFVRAHLIITNNATEAKGW